MPSPSCATSPHTGASSTDLHTCTSCFTVMLPRGHHSLSTTRVSQTCIHRLPQLSKWDPILPLPHPHTAQASSSPATHTRPSAGLTDATFEMCLECDSVSSLLLLPLWSWHCHLWPGLLQKPLTGIHPSLPIFLTVFLKEAGVVP